MNIFCSKDLVNWTDCGVVDIAGKNGGKGDAKWASNSWAPAIACKKVDGKDKFFLYFADSGNGIGVVVADSRYPRDGRFIEEIGYYNPMREPAEIKIDAEKAQKWIANGAQPTDTVKVLLKKCDIIK